jgi:NAD(P)-dependent dehydrogenase (short-subunit alcohol dehydrogenase family)
MGKARFLGEEIMLLDGKVSLVTGGARGIGQAISLALAREGADVVLCDIELGDDAQKTVEKVVGMGRRAVAIEADVSDEQQVNSMVERAINEMGSIHILINNAGVRPQLLPTIEQSVEAWSRVVNVHLRGTYLCCRCVGKSMIAQNYGRIANMASIGGMGGLPTRTDYGPAKAGIINLTQHLAVEWAGYNIRINSVSPGYVATGLLKDVSKKPEAGVSVNLEAAYKRIPMARIAETDEIANVFLFLVSDMSSYITGVNIPVDGGWTANIHAM